MALLPIHSFFSLNGVLLPANQFIPSENDGGIYEVVRVEQGIPLFWEEHMERFYRSAEIANKSIRFQSSEVERFVGELIENEKVSVGNVLISCKKNLKAFFIAHSYPSLDQYLNGVNCGILHAERSNPNAKVFQTEVIVKANQLISEHNFYEVILIDHEEKITEGSRSNVFFIKGEEIITPMAQKVLLGITRQKAIICAKQIGIEVKEMDVLLAELESFDAAFITGTSPKILPIKRIGNIVFKTDNSILRKLMRQYDMAIKNYIADKKSDRPSHF